MATVKKSIKKAQSGVSKSKGKSLPLGATSAAAERDYAKADSLDNVKNKMSGKEIFDRLRKGQPGPQRLGIMSDSLRKEGDKKTRSTGGVEKKYRLTKEDFQKDGGKTKKFEAGGSLSGLKASNKRVGPVDPKGAYTKVQKKTLAGAKGKATLKKDKQLGATKMKKGGMVNKCKYGCK